MRLPQVVQSVTIQQLLRHQEERSHGTEELRTGLVKSVAEDGHKCNSHVKIKSSRSSANKGFQAE